ncbi:MAG TPA: NAD(P)-dependent oxidoreductase [Candidatus Sulfotelmatobacter sp.]|nr:NAD(P)-dependent oxidoreductase [Candidatus Sulfotelmatobacter sp.]
MIAATGATTVVTGARGRLGRAVVAGVGAAGRPVVPWDRPEYDLDVPGAAAPLLARDQPGVVIHCAAWTDVDACARDPATAMRRNARAVRELAEATATAGARLVLVSTNEVFDGARTDGRGYREDDPAEPPNAYGASKLAGERAAAVAFGRAGRPADLWVIRTAWLFGPGAPDFPVKILAAADRLPPGDPLPVVADEVGSPTYAADLAAALLDLIERAPGGLYHLVNGGQASRAAWAEAVLRLVGRPTAVRPIPQAAYPRPSTPPRWAVLDAGRAATLGVVLRPWPDALAARLESLTGG